MHLTHFQSHSKHKKKIVTKKCHECRLKISATKKSLRTKTGRCRQLWEQWKQANKCIQCGIEDSDVLQADHYIGTKVKELSAYNFWSSHGGVEAMREEFKKVRCLCRFCHDIYTKKHFFGKKKKRRNTKKSRWEDKHKSLKTEYVLNEKLRRAECALCQRKVTAETSNCFKFDHGENYKHKQYTISYYINQNRCTFKKAKPILEREMVLCRLLCANCDWTYTKKDLWGHALPTPWEREANNFWDF